MPEPTPIDRARDEREEVVLGVDTHKDMHVAAVLSGLGALLASKALPTTAAGYRRLLVWARSFGTLRRAGVECTGSYGAALARHLHGEGIEVLEVNQPDKATRRKRGKTDAIDAEAAARAVLSGRATASSMPRATSLARARSRSGTTGSSPVVRAGGGAPRRGSLGSRLGR